MCAKREYTRQDVEALMEAAMSVLPLYSLLCDFRQQTLREDDSERLTVEGIGFIGAFHDPKRALEKAITRLRD